MHAEIERTITLDTGEARLTIAQGKYSCSFLYPAGDCWAYMIRTNPEYEPGCVTDQRDLDLLLQDVLHVCHMSDLEDFMRCLENALTDRLALVISAQDPRSIQNAEGNSGKNSMNFDPVYVVFWHCGGLARYAQCHRVSVYP